ncbi:MAG: oxaloacetate decarboxylase subunit alpha, partial [Synergistes sp.]|nr:oxaloacetate decarboxylase subunit alpha [Synergistes sp.]
MAGDIKKEIKDKSGKVIATKVSAAAGTPAKITVEEKKPETVKNDAPKKKARVGIMETAFRDAHQSIMATRLRTDDMLPICEAMDEVGYHSIEMWGGATFDAAMRFLNEDPWERLRKIRKKLKKTKTQML